MFKKRMAIPLLALSVLASGCATTDLVEHPYQCDNCQPTLHKVETQYYQRCPNAVEVIQFIPHCNACAYPVTIRSNAQTCSEDK
jgi:hypothetical protein